MIDGKFWDFTADMSHGDLAYSSLALPAHTDTTYFSDPAGLQIFHLLSHPAPGTGGTTLLVDAFHTASLLLTLHPTAYSTLSRLRIPCHASGTRGTLLRPVISQPVFRHDETGQLAQVRWNNEDRGVLGRGWRPEDVREWYKAARRFEELCRSEDAEYRVQLAPGTMVGEFHDLSRLTAVIDNWRVMHGRSAFTGARRMCGAYIGADDWRSRRAALKHGELSEWDVGW
jgi:trimethyllysine dioxygenase